MNYCTVDEQTKAHLIKLLEWLFDEVISAGGDGDAFWYSKNFSVADLLPLVEHVKKSKNLRWELKLDGPCIICHLGQQSLLITNEESVFPSWAQVKIFY